MALAEDLTAPEDDPEREAEQETDPDTDDDAAEVQNFWGSDVDRDEANDEALDTADASTDVADSDVAEMDQDFAPGGHPPKSAQPATVEASDMSEPLADEPNARDAESLPRRQSRPHTIPNGLCAKVRNRSRGLSRRMMSSTISKTSRRRRLCRPLRPTRLRRRQRRWKTCARTPLSKARRRPSGPISECLRKPHSRLSTKKTCRRRTRTTCRSTTRQSRSSCLRTANW